MTLPTISKSSRPTACERSSRRNEQITRSSHSCPACITNKQRPSLQKLMPRSLTESCFRIAANPQPRASPTRHKSPEVKTLKNRFGADYPIIVDIYATRHSRLGSSTPDYVEQVMQLAHPVADGVHIYRHQDRRKPGEREIRRHPARHEFLGLTMNILLRQIRYSGFQINVAGVCDPGRLTSKPASKRPATD